MALEYSLVIIGELSARDLLARLASIGGQDPRSGFVIRLVEGRRGYFEAEAGGEVWICQPDQYLNLGFRLDKDAPRKTALRHMLEIVAAVLETGHEDTALIFNGDLLILLRKAGKLTRFVAGGFWERFDTKELPAVLRVEDIQ